MSTPRRFKFTHRLIDGLPPNEPDAPSREAEYSDTEISGDPDPEYAPVIIRNNRLLTLTPNMLQS